MPAHSPTDKTLDWLLAGDPAIRWQAQRDLLGVPQRVCERERAKISREGWGAQLLAKQNANGKWASGKSPYSGLYSPKWISTTYTLLTLRDFGLVPGSRAAHQACGLLLDGGMQPDGGVNFGTWANWTKRGEACVTGMVLSICSYF